MVEKNYLVIWKAVLAELELSLSAATYQTWFGDSQLVDITKAGEVKIYVANIFTRDMIQKKYYDLLLDSITKQYSGKVTQISITTDKLQATTLPPQKAERSSTDKPTKITAQTVIPTKPKQSTYQERYTFDNFIVGSSNRLAFSAAQLVVERPGEAYNPLFLYGPAGVGKTHLMSAVATEISERLSDKKILYITSEQFTNEYVSAIRHGEKFTNKYREVDVLLVDDMQFIAGKEKTQEEFFHTFNSLHSRSAQIILCSDRPPKEIPTLEERLRSRFEWGMVADISPPDLETRIAILLNKASHQKVPLDNEVAEYIASVIDKNIRELEGALIKVIAYSRAHDQPISLEVARTVLDGVVATKAKTLSPKRVLEVCSQYYEVSLKDLLSTKRDREIVVPRQIAMYVMREELGISFPKIANSLGGKDHTTIMHGVRKITKLKQEDQQILEDITQIKQEMGVVT